MVKHHTGCVTGTLSAAKADQVISFPAIPDQVETSQVNLVVSAASGLPVAFTVLSGLGELADGLRLTFTDTGLVSIAASQGGNENWHAADTVLHSFTVIPARSPINGIIDGDFDGDGKADPTIYDERTGTWLTKLSTRGYATMTLSGLLGGPDYLPAVADYDGDGLSDPAVNRKFTGDWILMLSGSGYSRVVCAGFLGGVGWAPIAGDYDDDGRGDFGVYSAAPTLETAGNWWFKISSGSYSPVILKNFLGGMDDCAVSADYDGDGLADPAVMNPETGNWSIMLSGGGYGLLTLTGFLGGH